MEFQQQLLCSQLMERPLMLEEVRKLTVIIRALTVIVVKITRTPQIMIR